MHHLHHATVLNWNMKSGLKLLSEKRKMCLMTIQENKKCQQTSHHRHQKEWNAQGNLLQEKVKWKMRNHWPFTTSSPFLDSSRSFQLSPMKEGTSGLVNLSLDAVAANLKLIWKKYQGLLGRIQCGNTQDLQYWSEWQHCHENRVWQSERILHVLRWLCVSRNGWVLVQRRSENVHGLCCIEDVPRNRRNTHRI